VKVQGREESISNSEELLFYTTTDSSSNCDPKAI
jgi:hypothetical protein